MKERSPRVLRKVALVERASLKVSVISSHRPQNHTNVRLTSKSTTSKSAKTTIDTETNEQTTCTVEDDQVSNNASQTVDNDNAEVEVEVEAEVETKAEPKCKKFTFDENDIASKNNNKLDKTNKTTKSIDTMRGSPRNLLSCTSKNETELRYEVVVDYESENDQSLPFQLKQGNEGVFVSSVDDTKNCNVVLYSTIISINHQNVSDYNVEKVERTFSKLDSPYRITFRKSLVQTPYGIGQIVHRSSCTLASQDSLASLLSLKSYDFEAVLSGKSPHNDTSESCGSIDYSLMKNRVTVELEFGIAYLSEDCISKYIPNKQWTSLEEIRLEQLIDQYIGKSGSKSTKNSETNENGGCNSTNDLLTPAQWEKISEEFYSRSTKDVRRRWEHINALNHIVSQDILFAKLLQCTKRGDIMSVKRLVSRCPALVFQADKNRSTALFTACWYNHFEIVEHLILNGARVNHSNLKGNTAIHMALEQQNLDIINLLIANDASVSLSDLNSLIDRVSTITIVPAVVESIARADINVGDKVWYQHSTHGLIRCKVINEIREPLPMHYVLTSPLLRASNPVIKVSVLDTNLKPIHNDGNDVSLKELINKREKMMQRFDKWEIFWSLYDKSQKCFYNHTFYNPSKTFDFSLQSQSLANVNNTNNSNNNNSSNNNNVNQENNQSPANQQFQSPDNTMPSITTKVSLKKQFEDSVKSQKLNHSMSMSDMKQLKTTKHKMLKHSNYYLESLKKKSMVNRCIRLKKLNQSIAQHPDSKFEMITSRHTNSNSNKTKSNTNQNENDNNQTTSNSKQENDKSTTPDQHENHENHQMCYLAREHLRRFDIVMESMIRYHENKPVQLKPFDSNNPSYQTSVAESPIKQER